ncbi:DUF1993 family protein [Bradyrhizobium sp. B117]|uniref:DUF1993 family protein n=1 Tax=Bradyrhizobium sp. B117 TaxID=3140246 RepID=UPI003183AC0B
MEALESFKGFEAGAILGERLAPDMITFGEQFSVICNKVEAHIAKLMRDAPPEPRDIAMSYPALNIRLIETRSFLKTVQPDEIAGAQSHTYELTLPTVRGWLGGDDYIRHLVLRDFFFHISVAHAILRKLGAKIGKRDYSAILLRRVAVRLLVRGGAARGTIRALQSSEASLADAVVSRAARGHPYTIWR